MQTVDVNEAVVLTSDWWDEDKQPADPSSITLTITAPDGTQTVKHKADMSPGETTASVADVWEYSLTVDQDGVWQYQFVGIVDGENVESTTGLLLVGVPVEGGGPFEPWCQWSDVEALCPTINFGDLSPATKEALIDQASWILYMLDGARYPGLGIAEDRRICLQCRSCRIIGLPFCHCGIRSTIDLGAKWPVRAIIRAVVDGETLARDAYQVRNRRWLDRVDGDDWPACGDVTDPDHFTLSWIYGRRPPVGLVNACARFVAELAKKCTGNKCDLPQRVTQVSREGEVFVVMDSLKFLEEGKTGIYQVDLALAAAKTGSMPGPGSASPIFADQTHRVE